MHHALNHVRFRVRVIFCIPQSTFDDPQLKNAPIAQLDRASDYESAGRPFESGWARHFYIIILAIAYQPDPFPLVLIELIVLA
jgi:hypothetical protein